MPELTSQEDAQVINYLHATALPLALLVNFGAESLQWRCLIQSDPVPPLKIRGNSRN